MKKFNELVTADSCLNKAEFGEMLFVLLARDEAAPATIMFWVEERIRLGKNIIDDAQIIEAVKCAEYMTRQREQSNYSGTVE